MLPTTLSFALVLAAVIPTVAGAQAGFVQPLSTDADALAAQMRTLAANPLDVNALVTAGELSMKLEDLTAAAAFFARAEKVDPRNGRMKAGEAMLLVRGERPGAALRYFAQAESYGYDPRRFAADRGLAYDLIGEQERAQRDYRVALKSASDDETVRRYALSLGISGKRDQALERLAPLVRKSDRGAWRARAFILAMGGDVRGAETIATTMMPPGMARGLQPFFDRLPTLPAIDRAFAVHFGEVRAGPERFADARLAPALTPLTPEAGAPVQLASAQPVVAMPAPATKRGGRPKKPKRGRVQMAQVPIPAPAKVDLPPPPPVYRPPTQPPVALAQATPVRTYTAPMRTEPRVAGTPAPVANTQVAAARTTPPATPVSSGAIRAAVPVSPAAEARLSAVPPVSRVPVGTTTATTTATTPITSVPAPGFSASLTSVAQSAPAQAVSAPVAAVSQPTLAPAPVAVAPPGNAVARAGEDQILARIVAGLSIPASELGVARATNPVPAAVPVSVAPPVDTEAVARRAAEARAAERKAAEDKRIATDKLAADRKALADKATARKLATDKAAADKVAADKKAADKIAADKKATADKRALATKKAAADKKAVADKAAADEKKAEAKAAKADPERIWVQVAGGANEVDLPKAWAAVKKKAPEAFAGHQGYTTPLRATNRVATGPFKTDAEARAFVNALAKKGVSAFSFTSDKGQKVTRLPAK